MAFSAQVNIEERIRAADEANKKRSGWFSLQTFKAWKHVDDIVRAVPYMRRDYPKILAGAGIHHYYMTSENKVRPEYKVNKAYDPDAEHDNIGERIWDLAIANGMDYRSWVTNKRREKILHRSAALIDPSWSISYSRIGDHFNRVIIDALIAGAVPIARNLGIATNIEGNSEIFKPKVNYLMIPYDTTPREFATHIDMFMVPEYKKIRDTIVANGRKLLDYWDYRVVAQTFINLSRGKPAGYYNTISVGKHNKMIESRGNYLRDHFFNANPIKQQGLIGRTK